MNCPISHIFFDQFFLNTVHLVKLIILFLDSSDDAKCFATLHFLLLIETQFDFSPVSDTHPVTLLLLQVLLEFKLSPLRNDDLLVFSDSDWLFPSIRFELESVELLSHFGKHLLFSFLVLFLPLLDL